MFRKNSWKLISLLIIILMFATACGGQKDLDPMKMTLALSSPHVWIQPVIAQCEGYYEEVGLDLEIVRFHFRTGSNGCLDRWSGGCCHHGHLTGHISFLPGPAHGNSG